MKTNEELGISKAEYENLQAVRKMLDEEQIKKARSPYDRPKRDRFNMGIIASHATERECGTVMCIGGWVKALELSLPQDARGNLIIDEAAQYTILEYVDESDGQLRSLFYPNIDGDTINSFNSIRPSQAIQAIDNFLERGDPHWEEILTKGQIKH